VQAQGDLSERARRRALEIANDADLKNQVPPNWEGSASTAQSTRRGRHAGRIPAPGTLLHRVYRDRTVVVKILTDGFEYEGRRYASLSAEAPAPPMVRCAIYTRKSTEEGLSQEFNSLDAQRECAQAYILGQRQQGWTVLPEPYDDGGFSGAHLARSALQRLLADIQAGKVDCVVIYKVDRLSRSLFDFARIMQILEKHGVSFVSVTQQLNSNTPMGRLTLHVLLSFAQFEREIISERTRDKQSAARRKGRWTGGYPVLGYDADPRRGRLVVMNGRRLRSGRSSVCSCATDRWTPLWRKCSNAVGR
jgi:DNA invertase Pin-like site-specific DNA recombinase